MKLLQKEKVEIVITATAFASIQFSEESSSPIWDELDIPVIQLITSTSTKEEWTLTSRGLKPIDLTLQVALPELDGRITTRLGGFKEIIENHKSLCTTIKRTKPFKEGSAKSEYV